MSLNIDANLNAFGNKADHQANGIRQVELQTAFGVKKWLAVFVLFELPSLGSDRPLMRKRYTHQRTRCQ